MTSTQILKQNQELERKVGQLLDLSTSLLSENKKRSNEIERLMLQRVGMNNKILDIYLLLCSEIKENDILQTDSKNVSDMLDNIRVLIKKLLHNNESCKREEKILVSIIRNSKENSD